MSSPDSTHSIPTLTQRVDPPSGITPPQDNLPVLTERVQDTPARDHALNSGSFASEHLDNLAHQASGLEHVYADPYGPVATTAPWETQPHATAVAQPEPTPSIPASVSPTLTTEQVLNAVLRAALQAELEHAVHNAIDEAFTGIYARLDAELLTIIDRALLRIRSS
jgi:hypothetical protein